MLLWSNGSKANFRFVDDIFISNFAPAEPAPLYFGGNMLKEEKFQKPIVGFRGL
jgi:hypothetical protein